MFVRVAPPACTLTESANETSGKIELSQGEQAAAAAAAASALLYTHIARDAIHRAFIRPDSRSNRRQRFPPHRETISLFIDEIFVQRRTFSRLRVIQSVALTLHSAVV